MRTIVGIAGASLSVREATNIESYGLDVILFRRNIVDRRQTRDLVTSLKRLGARVSIDHEGGRVHRFPEDFLGISYLESARSIAANPRRLQSIRRSALVFADELATLGFDTIYAPVADIYFSGGDNIIGDRAYGKSAALVADAVEAFLDGSRGIINRCAKHFPGHGRYIVDSHVSEPVSWLPVSLWRTIDVVPFQRAVACGVEQIMCAHVRWAAFENIPSWRSSAFVKFARSIVGNDVELLTDDLGMGAVKVAGNRRPRTEDAMDMVASAGYDSVLLCNSDAAAMFSPAWSSR